MSPRTVFESELNELNKDVEEMFEIMICSYDDLFEALKFEDEMRIKRIMKNDRNINNMQRQIEGKCLTLITKQQPIAKDLRLVSAALKVVTDIERVGDHVCDMAELFLRLGTTNMNHYSSHLEGMAKATREMLEKAMKAFINRDMEIAKNIAKEDDVIDALFNKVKADIISYLKNQTKNEDDCIDVLMIAKYFEKIGDHAVNIAEWEMFKETGLVDNIRLL
ncbi:MAG: phosphate signaling complex protein PhoU [Lachnospiraceae bacterium]